MRTWCLLLCLFFPTMLLAAPRAGAPSKSPACKYRFEKLSPTRWQLKLNTAAICDDLEMKAIFQEVTQQAMAYLLREPSSSVFSFMIGSLSAFPELRVALIQELAQDPQWDSQKGKSKQGAMSRVLEDKLKGGLMKELFAENGFKLLKVDVEKVRAIDVSQLNLRKDQKFTGLYPVAGNIDVTFIPLRVN